MIMPLGTWKVEMVAELLAWHAVHWYGVMVSARQVLGLGYGFMVL